MTARVVMRMFEVNRKFRIRSDSSQILLEIVEQISIPLATVFNLSLEEGIVPLEWKEANIIPLFKKGWKHNNRGILNGRKPK